MKTPFRYLLFALAVVSIAACNKGGGTNSPTIQSLPPNFQTAQAQCNPSIPGMMNTPACMNPNMNPNIRPGGNGVINGQQGVAVGTYDIVDPGNGSTILRSRQFHLFAGYAQENGNDSCYNNPDTEDHTYTQSLRPIGVGASQAIDLVLSFDQNGVLTIQVNTPTGSAQTLAPAAYALDSNSSSITIQGVEGLTLSLAGTPNPTYANVEALNAMRNAKATDQELKDEYGMDDSQSSAPGNPVGMGAVNGITFDPHFHANTNGQPMSGQPMSQVPGQPGFNGQPIQGQNGAPLPGMAQNQGLQQNGVRQNFQTNGMNQNPLNNGANSISMSLDSGIQGQIIVSPANHQHVMGITIPTLNYSGAAVVTLSNATCSSQSSGQFIKLQLR